MLNGYEYILNICTRKFYEGTYVILKCVLSKSSPRFTWVVKVFSVNRIIYSSEHKVSRNVLITAWIIEPNGPLKCKPGMLIMPFKYFETVVINQDYLPVNYLWSRLKTEFEIQWIALSDSEACLH